MQIYSKKLSGMAEIKEAKARTYLRLLNTLARRTIASAHEAPASPSGDLPR
jgi:hypothetical protein